MTITNDRAGGRVLLLGGTGRTGRRVLARLLEGGVAVRAIVRSAGRLPAEARDHAGLSAVEADIFSMTRAELLEQVRGCDAIVSCLGHTIDLRGVFGPPRDLVKRAIELLRGAIAELRPPRPLRFVLMSSVSVHRSDERRGGRGRIERGVLFLIRGLVPPARDNQDAADLLASGIGTADPHLRWVVVRPDTLVEGEVSPYALHKGLVGGLARPSRTSMANVAHFMCDLATKSETWAAWEGEFPVIVDSE